MDEGTNTAGIVALITFDEPLDVERVNLLSYAGEVRIGVRADTAVTTDPTELIEAFEAELVLLENSG